jgi:hypothetical protein
MKDLHAALESVILKVGDLIVDEATGYVGVLVKRERRIDIFADDLYFWHIKWVKNIDRRKEDPRNVPIQPYLEEEGMKLSIAVGMITIYSGQRGDYEF